MRQTSSSTTLGRRSARLFVSILIVPLFVAALPAASQSRHIVASDRSDLAGITVPSSVGGAHSVSRHAAAVRSAPSTECRFAPVPNEPVPSTINAIDAILGQLDTHDETLLRVPLLAMCTAGAKARSGRDKEAVALVSVFAEIFAARLNEVRVPERTRAALAAKLVIYEHDLLHENEPMLASARSGQARR